MIVDYNYPNLPFEKEMLPKFKQWAKTELNALVIDKTGTKEDFNHRQEVSFDNIRAQIKFRKPEYYLIHKQDNQILIPIKDPRVFNGGQSISNDQSILFITVYCNENYEIEKVIFCSTEKLKRLFQENTPKDLKESNNGSGTLFVLKTLDELRDCIRDIWTKPEPKQESLEVFN